MHVQTQEKKRPNITNYINTNQQLNLNTVMSFSSAPQWCTSAVFGMFGFSVAIGGGVFVAQWHAGNNARELGLENLQRRPRVAKEENQEDARQHQHLLVWRKQWTTIVETTELHTSICARSDARLNYWRQTTAQHVVLASVFRQSRLSSSTRHS